MDAKTKQMTRSWALLVRAQHAVLSQVEASLKEAGYPPLVWYDMLLELDRDPDRGLRAVELEANMLLPQYGISRLLDRVEKAGYLRREICGADARSRQIHITPEGQALLKKMWPIYRQALDEALGQKLTHGESVRLAELLGKIT